jgi:hypothetical protein
MVNGAIPIGGKQKENNLSCTFCGPGTWAIWDVVTNDGVSFACDWHHAEMSQAKIIRLERMRDKEAWNKIPDFREALYEEKYVHDPIDFNDIDDYE